MSLQQAEALGNNQSACRDAAQQIRRAGVKMPEPLMALAALDSKFFNAAQPAGQPPAPPVEQPPAQPR
ncbi:MAG TPA: hypothetical protein VKA90_03780 [Beijerinckiaceae bacterium]|nr:hypothetical protein [Beijerinckiaceae bacterium]